MTDAPSLIPRLVSHVATATLLLCAACAAPTADLSEDATSGAEADTSDALASAATGYFLLESRDVRGAYTVSRANGGKLRCPDGARAARCTVAALVLPPDCDWECTDGLLSFRGIAVVRGAFVTTYDATARRRLTKLEVAAGFDTFDASLGSRPIYRITSTPVTCKKAPCPPVLRATRLGASGESAIREVDFASAHDPNYVLDPARGEAQMARKEGLLATGSVRRGVFVADRVFRQWTPIADCDVGAAARAYFFHAPEDGEINVEPATTAAAESYVDPLGRSVNWLVRSENKGTAVAFVGGRNDLWAQTFDVSTTTCAVTLTGEH